MYLHQIYFYLLILKSKEGDKMNIVKEIQNLKKEKNAIILAHYYVDGEIQEIADYVGDSYGLSKMVLDNDEDIIVFCGVSFMGESAKVLNPEKKVLLANLEAHCPMANMISPEEIEKKRLENKNICVVSYINSSAEIKAYSDICVTSSNALKIVEKMEVKDIFFLPDKNLATFVSENLPDKNIIVHDGFCYVHNLIDREAIEKAKLKHPKALVLVHPECNSEVFELADYIGSTAGILNYVKKSSNEEFIICTEKGILHQLKKENPDKKFYITDTEQICKDMKKVKLEQIKDVLKYEQNEVLLEDSIIKRARIPLERMLEYAK